LIKNGLHLGSYRKNPVVFFAHDGGSLPVWRATSIGLNNGRLVASMLFARNRFAQLVRSQVDDGTLRATSVGFRPISFRLSQTRKGEIDFHEQELLAFSIVPVPANPDALLISSS
jgi:HK97 family phage prohead protease